MLLDITTICYIQRVDNVCLDILTGSNHILVLMIDSEQDVNQESDLYLYHYAV